MNVTPSVNGQGSGESHHGNINPTASMTNNEQLLIDGDGDNTSANQESLMFSLFEDFIMEHSQEKLNCNESRKEKNYCGICTILIHHGVKITEQFSSTTKPAILFHFMDYHNVFLTTKMLQEEFGLAKVLFDNYVKVT